MLQEAKKIANILKMMIRLKGTKNNTNNNTNDK
jgi:hypothetical protein